MTQESFLDLIKQATEMLLDRPKDVRALIYHVAKMEDSLRAAIIIAYDMLKKEKAN